MILRFGLVEGGGQITTRALSSSNIAARPPYVLAIPQSLAQRKLIPRLHETRICVSRLALVQTFGINVTNARDHCAAQAARTAFQTAGAVLSLIRSLPSVN